jgi:hypothetical protein
VSDLDDGATALMVPFRLTLDEEGTPLEGTRPPLGDRLAGQLLLEGRHDEFEIETPSRPTGLVLDPQGEILAGFYSASRDRKRYLRYRAQDLALEGDLAAAESRYREALDVPVDSRSEMDGYRENLQIHLALARLCLDQRRHAAARAELDAVERDSAVHGDLLRVERDVLRSRLDIQRGEYASARRRLKKTLRVSVRDRGGRRIVLSSRVRLGSERRALAEAYALLAIAAHETGRREDLRWAADAARDRGVDVSRLIMAR